MKVRAAVLLLVSTVLVACGNEDQGGDDAVEPAPEVVKGYNPNGTCRGHGGVHQLMKDSYWVVCQDGYATDEWAPLP